MELLFSIFSPLLVGLTSILFSATLKLPTTPAKLIGIFTISFAEIVLIGEILGSTYSLSNRALWLLLQFVILLVAAGIWWLSNRPALNLRFTWSRAQLLDSLRQYPALWVLGLVVFFIYLVGAGLILYVPPNNHDGLTYHLMRVGYWLQFDSLYPWETINVRQTTFPLNAELGVLWTILVRGNDQLAGFLQWVSALVSAVTIFGLSRLLGFSRAQSAFPTLIYLTLSQIYLQSTTVQNDLVISAFFSSALYLLLLGIRRSHFGALLISGICIGLCVGTKSTAIFILPGLACAAALFLFQDVRGRFKLFLIWGCACIASILIWGVYIYVVNLLAFGNFLGAEAFLEDMSNTTEQVDDINLAYSRLDMLAINGPRYFTQMLDFSSLGEIGQEFTRTKYDLFNRLFDNTPAGEAWMRGDWDWLTSQTVFWGPHEDTAWFGLLGAFLFLPGIGYGFYLSVKRRNVVPFCIALLPIIFWILHSAAQPYTPAKGRYYVLPITASAVLMIWPVISNRSMVRLFRLSFIGLAIVTSISNVFFNENKPLLGSQSIINQQRAQRQGFDGDMDVFLNALDIFIPKDAKVILIGGESTIEYPAFGEYLTRYLVPVVVGTDDDASFESLRTRAPVFLIGQQVTHTSDRKADYILIDAANRRKTNFDTTGFEQIASGLGIVVYRALDTIEQEATTFRYEFDGTTPGSGWYSPTFSADGHAAQWMSSSISKLGTVRLSTANQYEVRFRMASYLDDEIANSLTLLANGKFVPIFRFPDNTFWGIIPAQVIMEGNGLLQLSLKTERVVSPFDLGLDNDPRPMGIAVDWLTVEPAIIGTSIRAEFDGQYPTSGFHNPEVSDFSFQWSSAAESSITLPLKVEGDLKLQFLVRDVLTVGSVEKLSLAVDGHPLEHTVEHTSEGALFTAFVPEFSYNDYFVTISFETIEPISPNALDTSSLDTRPLGFALDWLTIEPMSVTQ